MNILIIQTAFIGDVVLTTPLIRAARERLAAARLAVLIRPDAAELLRHNPCIDETIPYDKHGKARGLSSLLALARQLRQQYFDTALIPHRSFRSALIAWLARIPCRVGFETSAGRWLLTGRVPYRHVHEMERNLDLLRPWGITGTSYSPELFPDEHDQTFADEFLHLAPSDRPRPLIGVSPGSIWPTKRWLPERFAEVARRAEREWDARVLLFGGPEDAPLCRQIAERAGGVPLIAAGRATLLQSASLVSRCDTLISNDSAMAHIAAAMGTRVIALFGPTVPAFGFAPYGTDHRIIERSLPCRPCSRHGGKRCPIGTHECMRGIEVEEVLRAAQRTVTSDQ